MDTLYQILVNFGIFLFNIWLFGLIVSNIVVIFYMLMVVPPMWKLYPFMFLGTCVWFIVIIPFGYGLAKFGLALVRTKKVRNEWIPSQKQDGSEPQ